MPVLICDTDKIAAGDEVEINPDKGIIVNTTTGAVLSCGKIPPLMSAILDEGGLISYIQKHGDFVL
jgi:3-isopropylmalate/(R)-2-methylmalate dehydratase small subunit